MFFLYSHETMQRRQWHPTPVLLPGKSHGRRSLVGCSPWVTKSQTRLSDFTFTFHFHALGKEMATHSSVLAWSIPGMAEPGGLPSMGLHRVGHDWSDLAAAGRDYHSHNTSDTSGHQMCGFFPCTEQCSDTTWVFYSLTRSDRDYLEIVSDPTG